MPKLTLPGIARSIAGLPKSSRAPSTSFPPKKFTLKLAA